MYRGTPGIFPYGKASSLEEGREQRAGGQSAGRHCSGPKTGDFCFWESRGAQSFRSRQVLLHIDSVSHFALHAIPTSVRPPCLHLVVCFNAKREYPDLLIIES